MKRQPLIHQIRKEISAYPGDSLFNQRIKFELNDYGDTFISNLKPIVSESLTLKILYQGKSSDTPNDVIDKILLVNDSENTDVIWYRNNIVISTRDNHEKNKLLRKEALNQLLEKVNFADDIWIFEISK